MIALQIVFAMCYAHVTLEHIRHDERSLISGTCFGIDPCLRVKKDQAWRKLFTRGILSLSMVVVHWMK